MAIVKIGKPVLSNARSIQAVSDNGIVVQFPEPLGMSFHLQEVLSVDLELVDVEQKVTNISTGAAFPLVIPRRDVHDVRLPMAHGSSRFPSLARRRGANAD
jgi:hypothetical protein